MRYQPSLFKEFEEVVAPITDRHKEVIIALDVIRLERFLDDDRRFNLGRKPASRLALGRAFVAKSVLNLTTTVALIDRLKVDKMLRRICGFERLADVPSEGTFSNAFAEFSESGILTNIHDQLISKYFKDALVGHISRDATEIIARERMRVKKPKGRRKKIPTGYAVGRPKKCEIREKKPLTRIQIQMTQPLKTIIDDLPKQFDCGSKRGSRGNPSQWFGYKLHMDVCDAGIPISCLLTSASLNDSQVSIPLEIMSNSRVSSLYTLADKAYDAEDIRVQIRSFGKVPLIQAREMTYAQDKLFDPASIIRFKTRTTIERSFSRLKDCLGLRQIRVRGHSKVQTHIMFGILALSAFRILETHF
jgi:hypothetical protein